MLRTSEPAAAVPDQQPTLRTGELARLASVNVETLRYYEKEGLLEKPYQHLSGYRAYPVSAVTQVQSIKRAQALGFSLIRNLLKGPRGERVANEASRKLAEINGMMVELERAKAELQRMVEYGCDRLVGCSCGQADCPTRTAEVAIAPTTTSSSASNASTARSPGRIAGALLTAGCAACCAPLVGAALAAAGVPALAATEGLELGLGAAALAAGGIVLNRLGRGTGRSSR